MSELSVAGLRPKKVAKRADLISSAVVASNVALVLLPLYLAAAFGPHPSLIVWWLWFGCGLQGLLNLLHECAHLHVFKRRSGSEFVANWIIAPLLFTDFERYRTVHWAHHNHLGTDRDPKYSYKLSIEGGQLISFVARSLLLVEAMRKFRYVHGTDGMAPRETSSKRWMIRTVVVQALLGSTLAIVAWAAHDSLQRAFVALLLAYGFTYIYGLLSLTVMMANLRAIAEHQLRPEDEAHGDAALRNLNSNWVTHFVFGSYGFSEHATHHRAPSIPYYLLRAETARMAIDEPALAKQYGYLRSLRAAVNRPGGRNSTPAKRAPSALAEP